MWTAAKRFQPYTLSLLRFFAAFELLQHGVQKFGLLEGRVRSFPDITWFGMWIEVIGGSLMALGLWTQPVAFILSGEMAVAYFRTHAPRGFWPLLNGGEPAVLLCFIFLYLATAGGGILSLDHLMTRRSRR